MSARDGVRAGAHAGDELRGESFNPVSENDETAVMLGLRGIEVGNGELVSSTAEKNAGSSPVSEPCSLRTSDSDWD